MFVSLIREEAHSQGDNVAIHEQNKDTDVTKEAIIGQGIKHCLQQ
jgi:hypothetical protein